MIAITIITLLINIFAIFFIITNNIYKIENAKFLLFKKYQMNYTYLTISVLWVILLAFVLVYEIQSGYSVYMHLMIYSLFLFLCAYIFNVVCNIKLNKTKYDVKKIQKIDFEKLISVLNKSSMLKLLDSAKIKDEITKQSKKKNSLMEQYNLLNLRIQDSNSFNYVSLLTDAILFNEANYKNFAYKHNILVYKLTLYLI
jgi:hypothetical protein